MSGGGRISLEDLERAITARSPELGELIVRYSKQPDLAHTDSGDPANPRPAPGADAWTVERLRSTLHPDNLAGKDDEEKKAVRRAGWDALNASPYAPERLKLAALLTGLYTESPDAWTRTTLIHFVKHARLRWGTWKAFKSLTKEAERRHDAELFGAIAYRLDETMHWRSEIERTELSGRTLGYMRRRAWRYLRMLGQSVPELFPEMAVQVLRHYPADGWMTAAWIANHIFAHGALKGWTTAYLWQQPKIEQRAFHEAWKLTPAPLLFLLEASENEQVCGFAIRSLEADFEGELRDVDVDWLRRIGEKPLAVTQQLVVKLLSASPEYHQSKLKGLGLHEMVLGLLSTSDAKVAEYAVEYAKAHEPNLSLDRLVALAQKNLTGPVFSLVKARLEAMKPESIGLAKLFEMLSAHAIRGIAEAKIKQGFGPSDIDEQTFVRAYVDGHDAFLNKLFADAKQKVPTRYLVQVVEDEGFDQWRARRLLQELGKRPGEEIGMDWFKGALFRPATQGVASRWLQQGKLKGDALDVEWVKDLTRRPTMRSLALSILRNREIVKPRAIGAAWLLGLLNRADPTLSSFGREYLLSSFGPDDFEGGVEGVWALTSPKDERGRKRKGPQRTFAFDWLRMHHPELGPTMAEARSLGVEAKGTLAMYTLSRVRPLLSDSSPDARRFAADIARLELVRWGDADVPYQLAASAHPEPRKVGVDALLELGGQGERRLPEEWLSGERVFAMAESPQKATRELALTLIRQNYAAIGGAERLAWLMESPEREVRLFAVKMLWDQHRPGGEGETFASADALRQFLRTVLFGLPPGRLERREGGDVDRPLKSGVAKRRLIELVRDMGLEDVGFAGVVRPILDELASSEARGEWEACVAALARLRAKHPALETALPAGRVEAREAQPARGRL